MCHSTLNRSFQGRSSNAANLLCSTQTNDLYRAEIYNVTEPVSISISSEAKTYNEAPFLQ